MGLPMRKNLKTMWNWVDPSCDYRWVWTFSLLKLVLHALTSVGLSVLHRIEYLLKGEFDKLRDDFQTDGRSEVTDHGDVNVNLLATFCLAGGQNNRERCSRPS